MILVCIYSVKNYQLDTFENADKGQERMKFDH